MMHFYSLKNFSFYTLPFVFIVSVCASGQRHQPMSTERLPANEINLPALYENLFPRYAEFCAATRLRKTAKIGLPLEGGPFGHAIMYIKGACRDKTSPYPKIQVCPQNSPAQTGVGISTDGDFKNVNWVAVEDRQFFYTGVAMPNTKTDLKIYRATLEKAKQMEILKGVTFHERVCAKRPAGMSDEECQYEDTMSTDFAVNLGRNVYCARVPLTNEELSAIIHYLNHLNDDLVKNNKSYMYSNTNSCTTTPHNALATIGLWAPYKAGSSYLEPENLAIPFNNYVDLMNRTNDLPIENPVKLFNDRNARISVLQKGLLATRPGGITEIYAMSSHNEVYDSNSSGMFLDLPILNPTKKNMTRYQTLAHYRDIRANLLKMEDKFETALEKLRQQTQLDREYLSQQVSASQEGGAEFASSQKNLMEFQQFCANLKKAVESKLNDTRDLIQRADRYLRGGK